MELSPTPLIDPDSAGFWQHAASGQFALQQCAVCGRYQFPPLETCRLCRGALVWKPVSGRGTVFSFIVQHYPAAPGFEHPYAIALITPDGATELRIPGRIAGDPHRIRIGDRVQVRMIASPDSKLSVPEFTRSEPKNREAIATPEKPSVGPRPMTVTGLLASAMARDPDRVFICFGSDGHTYAEIDAKSNQLARGLSALGVTRGDRVTTMLDNCLDAVLAWFAVNKIGAVLVPLNTALKRDFLRRPLMDSGAELMITEPAYLDRIAEVADGLGPLRTILCSGKSLPPLSSIGVAIRPLDSARASVSDPMPDVNASADLAMIVYTSGTTGVSKGCMLSHNYICNIGRMGVNSVGYRRDDVLWTALPLFHINAMGTLLAAMMVGARAVFEHRFSLSGFWPSIEASGATVASVLGSMSPLITSADDTEASLRCRGRLRAVVGAPFTPEMRACWHNRFGVERVVIPGFGQTEAALITSFAAGETGPQDSAGRLNDEFEVRIVDEHGVDVPIGTAGELICRPRYPHIMFEGYWCLVEKTAEAIRGGWYYSGDIGKLDEEGHFYFLGRKAEYLRCRGENVSAFEIETTFLGHPGIKDVAVYAVKSLFGEDDIMLAATVRPEANLTEEALFQWACDRLPRFAVPSYIEFQDELPRNPLGKIMKYKLAERGITGRTWAGHWAIKRKSG